MARLTWRSYAEGPRWAGFANAIRKAALFFVANGYDIRVDEVDVQKGLLRETTFFTISSSDEADLAYFQKHIFAAIREWNR